MHTLLSLDPGHFHAALLLRRTNPRIAPDVHVNAPAGAERDAFCALIEAFNAHEQDPTRWRLHVHQARDRDATSRVTAAPVRKLQRPVALAFGTKVTSALLLSRRGQPRAQLPQ